jgi:predicted glycosyltransferase
MARSTYIYIVFKDCSLFAAYTVKHELVSSLPRKLEDFRDLFKVYRVRDIAGMKQEIVDISLEISEEVYA